MIFITMSRAKCVSQSQHFKQSRVIALDERIFACERGPLDHPPNLSSGEKTHIVAQPASQAERKQKGKHMCVFPIAVYFSLEWLYRPLQLIRI